MNMVDMSSKIAGNMRSAAGDNGDSRKVIVSLTSFPAAIPYAVGAIESLLRGSVQPDRIVLYLTFSQFGEAGLPKELLMLEKNSDILELRDYPRDIRSYRKLVPALREYPDAVIVTVDDDVRYHRHMLRDLLRLHEEFPEAVLAHRAKKIAPGLPYRKWHKYRWYDFVFKRLHRGFMNIQTGVGGVLYPPGALKKEMIDEQLFTRIAPTADDFWFWAAAVANGTEIIPVPFGRNKPKGLGKPRTLSLKTVNFKSGTDRNTVAFESILKNYPEIMKRIQSSMSFRS